VDGAGAHPARYAGIDLAAIVRNQRISGPARTRTEDQGIHSTPPFPVGADYLFTLVGCGTLVPVIKRNSSAQVVSAPSGGVPPAWLRVAIGIAPLRFP
jgi:hypothetical protein